MKANKVVVFSAALAAGLAVGWYLAGQHLERHRADLFSANRFRRLAALSYLAGQAKVETVRLLADYIAWEPSMPLRRRGMRVKQRIERELASA